QLLLWEELLASEALVAFAAIVWLAALNRDALWTRGRYAIRALGAAALVFLVLAAVPLGFQFFGPRQVHGAVWPPNQFVIDLLAWGPLTTLAGRTPPFPVALLALAFPPLTRDVRPARLMLYVFLAIWIAMAFVPIVNDILPSRLTLFVFLFCGLLLALIVDATLKSGRPRRIAILAVVTALAVFALVPRQPFPTTGTSSPSFFTTDAVRQIPD